jgi:hypothetical protein
MAVNRGSLDNSAPLSVLAALGRLRSAEPTPTAAPVRLLTDATTILGKVLIEEGDHPLPGVLSLRLGVGQPDRAFDDADRAG